MEDQLPEIKSKIDIVDLISSHVSLKKAGRNYRALCPFHSEKTPSFMVSPELQIFKCFGCQASGDIFSFVMRAEGLEFPAALKLLADRAGVKLKTAPPAAVETRKEKLYRINSLAGDFFHFLLTKHAHGEKARNYLKERGVRQETIKQFSLGYAPASWRSLASFLTKKGFSPSEIIESGLALPRKSGHGDLPIYDRFRSRLMFSLRDPSSRIVGFSGRALGSGEPKYLNSPETPIFRKGNLLYGLDLTKSEIRKSGSSLVVEGQFDLILPYQEGFRAIVASLGTALTDWQLSLLKRFAKNITLVFDQDIAGSEATVRSARIAENMGFTVSVSFLPEGAKDPDEAVRFKKEEFTLSIEKSLPFYDYYLVMLTKGRAKEDIREKRFIAEKFLAEISQIEDPLSRSYYLKKLSGVLEMDPQSLSEVLQSLSHAPQRDRSVLERLVATYPTYERIEVLSRYLLYLFLRVSPELVREVISKFSPEDFLTDSLRAIFSEIKKSLAGKSSTVDAKTIRDRLDEPVAWVYDEIFLLDLETGTSDIENARAEIESARLQLSREIAKKKMGIISTKIKEAEMNKDMKEVEALRKQLQKAAEKIE